MKKIKEIVFTKEINWILNEKYFNKKNKIFFKDIEELKKGKPVDYIIGNKPFLNCKIDLSFNTLIPRIETEYWVEKFIKEINKNKKELKILDIFSGSGCIGISILKNCEFLKVDFAEIENNCLKQIRKNLKINNISKSRFKIIKSDMFENIKEKYDFILANPPYISLKRKNKVQDSVLNYEPLIALFGGNDGLFYIKNFLFQAKNFLKKNGKIWLEFDSFQKNKIEIFLKKQKYKNIKFFKDQFKNFRYANFKFIEKI